MSGPPFSNWSEDDFRKFERGMREQFESMSRWMRDDLAGVSEETEGVRFLVETRRPFSWNGIDYGTLISRGAADELEEIRREALLLHAERRGEDGRVLGDNLLERVIRIVGNVFVSVDAPHPALGERGARTMSVALLLELFSLAYARRPLGNEGR